MAIERQIPSSIEAEQHAVGAVLMRSDALAELMEFVSIDDIRSEGLREILQTVIDLDAKNQLGSDLDAFFNISEALRKAGKLEAVGGVSLLTALMEGCPNAHYVNGYAKVIVDRAQRRRALQAATKIKNSVYSAENSEELIEQCDRAVQDIAARQTVGDFVTAGEVADLHVASMLKSLESPESKRGTPTGFYDFDRLTFGLHPSRLIIVAARPSMGKSALMLQWAFTAAQLTMKPSIIFSLEMSKEDLTERLISNLSGVSSYHLKEPQKLIEDEWLRVEDARKLIKQVPLFIVDTPGLTTFAMKTHARRIAARFGTPSLISIDYLQIAGLATKYDNTLQKVSQIAMDSKNLARIIQCPVVALSQLSRKVEDREDKRPILSDLRDSGSIEAEADVVAFPFRPAYYRRKQLYGDGLASASAEDFEEAELLVPKHRHGRTGEMKVQFNNKLARFENLERGAY